MWSCCPTQLTRVRLPPFPIAWIEDAPVRTHQPQRRPASGPVVVCIYKVTDDAGSRARAILLHSVRCDLRMCNIIVALCRSVALEALFGTPTPIKFTLSGKYRPRTEQSCAARRFVMAFSDDVATFDIIRRET